jgi:sulfoxide reductase catalytic subunit YedY
VDLATRLSAHRRHGPPLALSHGKALGEVYGAPLRLRVENQLGFKMVKWIRAIEFVEKSASVGAGEGGYNEDHEYFGELANI